MARETARLGAALRTIVLIACLALSGRVIAFIALSASGYSPDARAYMTLGQELAEGRPPVLDIWIGRGVQMRAFRPLGVPLALAALIRILGTPNLARQTFLGLQIIMSMGSWYLVGSIAGRVLGHRVALWAWALAAINPALFFTDWRVGVDTPLLFLILLSVRLSLAVDGSRRGLLAGLGTGATLGLAFVVKQPALFYLPAILALLVARGGMAAPRRYWASVGLVVLGMVPLATPWVVYASNAVGRFSLGSTEFCAGLCTQQWVVQRHPEAKMVDIDGYEPIPELENRSEAEVVEWFRVKYGAWIKAHRWIFIESVLHRAWDMWANIPNFLLRGPLVTLPAALAIITTYAAFAYHLVNRDTPTYWRVFLIVICALATILGALYTPDLRYRAGFVDPYLTIGVACVLARGSDRGPHKAGVETARGGEK